MTTRKILTKTTAWGDTEGHFMLPNPDMHLHLAKAREEDIQRNLRRRQAAFEARRPYNKRGRDLIGLSIGGR